MVPAPYPRRENGFSWEAEVVCTLPRDAVVTLDRDPLLVEKVGWWIAVVPGSVQIPD